MTNYSNRKLGEMLMTQIGMGYDVIRISRWAYGVYYDHRDELNNEMRMVLKDLARMEDDPQFEYSEQELKVLAELLILGEKDPLNKIK